MTPDERKTAIEALKPFAEAASLWTDDTPDSMVLDYCDYDNPAQGKNLTLGHLRRAAAAYEALMKAKEAPAGWKQKVLAAIREVPEQVEYIVNVTAQMDITSMGREYMAEAYSYKTTRPANKSDYIAAVERAAMEMLATSPSPPAAQPEELDPGALEKARKAYREIYFGEMGDDEAVERIIRAYLAHKAAAPVEEWRTIDSAPKDGAPIESGMCCEGCGSLQSLEEIQANGFKSCCPERRMLHVAVWRRRALAAENRVSAMLAAAPTLEPKP